MSAGVKQEIQHLERVDIMASVHKYTLKDGQERWRVRYKIKVAGKWKSTVKDGFKKEGDAKRWKSAIEVKLADKSYVAKSAKTLRSCMEDYVENDCGDLAPKTIESYRSNKNKINQTFIADLPAQDVTPEDIRKAMNYFRKPPKMEERNKKITKGKKIRPMSENTIHHYLRFLNLVFKQLKDDNQILSNPVSFIKKPKVPEYEHYIVTIEDYKKLVEVNKGTPMYIPILLGGYMGLRKGEALGLTWPKVQFRPNKIKINKVRQIVEKEEVIKPPKSEKSIRDLFMPQKVAKALKTHKATSVIDISRQLVCCTSTGEPLSVQTFTQRWKRALKRAELPDDIRFHDLRHTCAAFLVAAGASPKEVSTYLGHSSIAITMDLYADLFDTTKEKTAQKMDELLGT